MNVTSGLNKIIRNADDIVRLEFFGSRPGFHFNVISHLSKRIMAERIITEERVEFVSLIG